MEKNGYVQIEIGGIVSVGIVEKISLLGILNFVKSSILGVDEIFNREFFGEEFDKLSVMCDSDKDRVENNFLDKDVIEFNNEYYEFFSRGQVKEKCEDDLVIDIDFCCLIFDSKMNFQGIF